jgi:glycosyltransferase involved in cell wall biosynthesis
MNKEPAKKQTVLYLFNLKTDSDDPILSFSLEWIDEFAKHFNEVKVFTTHKGKAELNSNVTVTEIGGGSNWSRAIAILRLYRILFQIISEPQKPIVFHHMSVHTITMLGLPLKLARIKQGMWYSHSAKNLELRVASIWVTKIFSSSPAAFPLKRKKTDFVGHGIKTSNFLQTNQRAEGNDFRIVSIGRVTPIKSLEKIIEALHHSNFPNKKVVFIGPIDEKDLNYFDRLKTIGKTFDVEVEFLNSVPRKLVPNILEKYGIFYTGTPGSTDKAAIEAAIAGCYILTVNPDTQKLLGMSDFWKSNQLDSPSLIEQLEFIANRPHRFIQEDRKRISSTAARNNDLANVVAKMVHALSS